MNITDCIKNAIAREFPELIVTTSVDDEGVPLEIYVDNIPTKSDWLIFGAVGDLIGQCVGYTSPVSLTLQAFPEMSPSSGKYTVFFNEFPNDDDEEE